MTADVELIITKRSNDLLLAQIEKLHEQLDEAIVITPHDLPGDALARLEQALGGWPRLRWCELARLILQEHAA